MQEEAQVADIRDDHPSGVFRGIFYGLGIEIVVCLGIVLAAIVATNALSAIRV